jgi:hypothetical protein
VTYARGSPRTTVDATGFSEACDAARGADAVVLVMGIDQNVEAEGTDRTEIGFPVIQQLLVNLMTNKGCFSAGARVILVTLSGGSMDYTPFLANERIDALLWAGYPGQAGGAALANLLFGAAAPSGRLPHTVYPSSFVDVVDMTNMNMPAGPTHPGYTYRYYPGPVVLPFGHGLSYTTWNFLPSTSSPTTISASAINDLVRGKALLWNHHFFTVTVNVTNTGQVASKVSVLLFVRNTVDLQNVGGRLADFGKTAVLQPGQTTVVTLKVSGMALVQYSASARAQQAQIGQYTWWVKDCEIGGSFGVY